MKVIKSDHSNQGGDKIMTRAEESPGWQFVELPQESLTLKDLKGTNETDVLDHPVFSRGCTHPPSSSDLYTENLFDDTAVLALDQIKEYRKDFTASVSGRVAQNAVATESLNKVSLSREILLTVPQSFSIILDRSSMPVTDQKNSGRCWLFGTLNLFRFGTSSKLKLDTFEFSESYLYFFHILEQVNSFLEFIIATAKDPLDDRVVSQLIADPIGDGGDWGIAVNLLKKYGLVPKSVYPETHSSSNTDELMTVLTKRLKYVACQIRRQLFDGSTADRVRVTLKTECLASAYRILCIHLGTPPLNFNWQWRSNDESGDLHRLENITPKQFCNEYVTVPFATDYVSLIQDPRHEYNRRYTVDYSTTVCGGEPMIFLNVSTTDMKRMALQILQDGEPLWFACNVDVECDNRHGIWDSDLYNLEGLYNLADPRLTKKEQIEYGGTMGNHVMLMTGVDVGGDKHPRCWRVENSWGARGAGDGGYYAMNDNWFDDNVFEIVVPVRYLNAEESAGLRTKPIVLPAWDAMCCRHRGAENGRIDQ